MSSEVLSNEKKMASVLSGGSPHLSGVSGKRQSKGFFIQGDFRECNTLILQIIVHATVGSLQTIHVSGSFVTTSALGLKFCRK